METLDFSCSSRKREEVDGKALAGDKTVLSSLFLSLSLSFSFLLSSLFPDSIVSSLFRLVCMYFCLLYCRGVRRIFVARIQILCEEVRKCRAERRMERRWHE